MEYLNEFTNQLNALSKGEKTRIDVHYIVSDPLKSFCYEINQKINKHIEGFISMGTDSILLPHVSLFMGYIDNFEGLKIVFSIVNEYAKKLTPFILEGNTIYFTGVSRSAPQYLFIDSRQNDYIMQQKEILDNLLNQIVSPVDWDMKRERAHITIGCYKQLSSTVRKIADSYQSIPSCKISQIGVSLTGKRGVCLSALKTFDLDQAQVKDDAI